MGPCSQAVPARLVIIGAGGFGREVLDIVEALNADRSMFEFLGFLDDDCRHPELISARKSRILGPINALREIETEYVIGIASPRVRERVDSLATSLGRRAATLVHPSASLGHGVDLGPGSIVCSHAAITTNVQTGRHVHFHVNCSVGHDVIALDYVTVLPGSTVSGNVRLETGSTLGTGSAILQGLKVGRGSMVGAGGVVVKDVPDRVTVVGVPARPLRRS